LTMEAFRTADRQIGGGHLYASVVRYLQVDLGPRLLGTVSDDNGSQLFCAAAGLSDMAGWMAHDGGQDLLARQHFDRAVRFSELSGDRQLLEFRGSLKVAGTGSAGGEGRGHV
jgi:hypothetical protein